MTNIKELKNRYYGVTGVNVVNSMPNADFDHLPPRTYNDLFMSSNFSYKYGMRIWYKTLGYSVLGLRQMKQFKNKLVPKTIDEIFTDDTNIVLKKDTDMKKVLEHLLEYTDVRQHGVTFPVNDNNISITGATQITDGINLDNETNLIENVTGSQFRNSSEKKSNASETTLGSRNILDHAMYAHSFSVIPNAYEEYKKILDNFEGYTEEDFKIFKKAILHGISHLNSVAKTGCTNAFAIFVKCKENTIPTMGNLHLYVSYKRTGLKDKRVMGELDITDLFQYLKPKANKIEDIEIYIQPLILSVVADIDGEKVTIDNSNSHKLFDGKVSVRLYEIEEEILL